MSRVEYLNPRQYLPLEEMYFGASFLLYVQKEKISPQVVKAVQLRLLGFYTEGVRQIFKRFDFKESSCLNQLSFIQPDNNSVQSIIPVIMQFPNLVEERDYQALDNEWRLFRSEKQYLKFETDDTEEFWRYVSKIKKGDGNPAYALLVDVIFKILSFPHSSANVERIFSVINLTKTKTRNRLQTDSLIGLLLAKELIKESNCYEFEITKEKLSKFNKNMYTETVESVDT